MKSKKSRKRPHLFLISSLNSGISYSLLTKLNFSCNKYDPRFRLRLVFIPLK